ncbi:MAG: hypothetical protein WDO19_02000 [Bacteroidota bacterium]
MTSSFLTGQSTTSATPSAQVSNAVFSSVTTNSVVVTWTNGNGARRLVVVREAAPVNADPVNSQSYAVNSSFGSGAQVGTGNYTVYNSTGTNTSITNLKPGTQYYFSFYEFNGVSQPQYNTPAYTSDITTRSIPTAASSNVIISKADGKELSLSWTNGNGQRRIIIARQGGDITSVPADGTDYTSDPVFGNGSQLNAGEFVVYDDNFNEAAISGLNPGTLYYFKIFEYDGTGNTTIYLTNSFGAVNGTTVTTPSLQSSGIAASVVATTSATLQWTTGNGRARLVVARKNTAVNFSPSDFSTYTANSDFGNGPGPGQR